MAHGFLCVIAGAMGDDATLRFGIGQAQDGVAGAAKLECANLLKLFALKEKLAPGHAVERGAGRHRRAVNLPANPCRRGAYILAGDPTAEVRLIASGSEVHLAIAARELLANTGISAAAVSMPSWELFAAQDDTYRAEVLGPEGTVRVACEAASGFGWERWLGTGGGFVGMQGFGASGKAADLFKHFGITAEAIAGSARRLRNHGG